MKAAFLESCGCFPTGRHYPGIAHLLRAITRGLVDELAAEAAWAALPIALVDVETTGTDASNDRVVEIGIAIARGGEIVERRNWLVNPGRPIPKEASDVHKITDDDVKDAPPFATVAQEIAEALLGCVPAAYNAAFDRAFLTNELARAGMSNVGAPAFRKNVEWVDPRLGRELQQGEKVPGPRRGGGPPGHRARERPPRQRRRRSRPAGDAGPRPRRSRPAVLRGHGAGAAPPGDGPGRRAPPEQMAVTDYALPRLAF